MCVGCEWRESCYSSNMTERCYLIYDLSGNLRVTNCIFSVNQRWLVSVWYLYDGITRYGLTTGVKSNSWSVQLTALEWCIRRCNYLSIRCEIAADLTGSIHLMPVSFPLLQVLFVLTFVPQIGYLCCFLALEGFTIRVCAMRKYSIFFGVGVFQTFLQASLFVSVLSIPSFPNNFHR